jgi:hypothetical protein
MPNQKEVAAAHDHDLKKLAGSCSLAPEEDSAIRIHWNVVAPNWGPDDRYRIHSEVRATQIVEAAGEVLEWLKPQW